MTILSNMPLRGSISMSDVIQEEGVPSNAELMKTSDTKTFEFPTFEYDEEDIDNQIEVLKEALLTPGLPDWFISAVEHRIWWLGTARPNQLPPEDDFYMWLFLAGRGAGKTKSCAEDCFWFAISNPGVRTAVIAPRFADLKITCFEGDSGLVGAQGSNDDKCVIPRFIQNHPDFRYNRSTYEIMLPNGSSFTGFTSETPEALRGPQFHRIWFEELAAWKNMQEVYDQAVMTLRLKTDGRGKEVVNSVVASTTPKPRKLIKQLLKDKDVVKSRGSTLDNIDNLGAAMIKKIKSMEGTDLYKQEVLGEVLDFDDVAVPRKSWQIWPRGKRFDLPERIVISLDTAYKDGKRNDSSACTIWAVQRVRMMRREKHPYLSTYVERPDHVWIVMLVGSWKEKLLYPDLKAKVRKTFDHWKEKYVDKADDDIPDHEVPIDIVIEDKASGTALLAEYARAGLPVHPFNPMNKSKKARVDMVSEIFRSKKVYALGHIDDEGEPVFAKYAEGVVSQFEEFTGRDSEDDANKDKSDVDIADVDDYVDAAVAGLQFIRDQGYIDVDSDVDYFLRSSQEEMDFEDGEREFQMESLYG
jgi:phage terminase large subunit-like protein